MSIVSIYTDTAGQVSVNPRRVKIISTDNLATVTTAGYLNPVNLEGYLLSATDVIDMIYSFSNGSGTYEIFTLSISSSGVITLVQWANPGDVLLPVVSGDFSVFNGTTGQIKDAGYSASNAAKTKVVMANGTVIANHIAAYTDTAGTAGVDPATAINGGNIQAGLSGTAGTLASFPSTASKGSLIVAGVANTGNTNTTISNAAMGQASVVSIPDPGVATTNFILADNTGTQTIATGSVALTAGNLTATAGNLQAGSSGHAGTVSSFSSTASRGSLILAGVANSGNTNTTISNAAMGQASVISIPDPATATATFAVAPSALVSGNIVSASGTAGLVIDGGLAANKVLTSAITTPDVSIDLVAFDVTVGQAALASAGSVTLVTSSGSKQYKIRSLQLNSGGTNFSGGGGDRLGQVTDGTTVYSVVPAATMQSLANAQWGVTALPNPASAAINTSTVAGANLSFKYSGGTTDYSAGSLVITGVAQRVA